MESRRYDHLSLLKEIITIINNYIQNHPQTIRANARNERDELITIAKHVYTFSAMMFSEKKAHERLSKPGKLQKFPVQLDDHPRPDSEQALIDLIQTQAHIMDVVSKTSKDIHCEFKNQISQLLNLHAQSVVEYLQQRIERIAHTNHNESLSQQVSLLRVLTDAHATLVEFLSPSTIATLALTCHKLNDPYQHALNNIKAQIIQESADHNRDLLEQVSLLHVLSVSICYEQIISSLSLSEIANLALTCQVMNSIVNQTDSLKAYCKTHFPIDAPTYTYKPEDTYSSVYQALSTAKEKRSQIDIFVKDLTSKTVTVRTNKEATVSDFHQTVADKLTISNDQLRLLFCGMQLDANSQKTIDQIKLIKYSTVHALVKVRGD